MDIELLADFFEWVSGLDKNQAKVCICYAATTYHLDAFDWVPILEIIGPTGTGKTRILDLMGRICHQPHVVDCDRMTTAVLREELAKARGGTFIGEEADNLQGGKEAEALFGARCSRKTCTITVNRPHGNRAWIPETADLWGATLIHHRRSFLDQAVQNRSISIRTKFQVGTFTKLSPGLQLSMPPIPVGTPPTFAVAGRAYDTWSPLLAMAAGAGDQEWLAWAEGQLKEASEELKDGQSFEPETIIFARVVQCLTNQTTGKVEINLTKQPPTRVDIQEQVVEPLRRTLPTVTPWLVSRTLKKLKLDVIRRGGTNWVYPTERAIKSAADQIGYEDDALP